MKRTALLSRSGLRRVALRRSRTGTRTPDAWKEPQKGFCECGCGRPSWRLHRHHVVYRQHVHREGGDEWALRNSMLLHPDCHAAQHSGYKRVPLHRIPEDAVAFAVDLFGEARAAEYLRRFYDCEGGA